MHILVSWTYHDVVLRFVSADRVVKVELSSVIFISSMKLYPKILNRNFVPLYCGIRSGVFSKLRRRLVKGFSVYVVVQWSGTTIFEERSALTFRMVQKHFAFNSCRSKKRTQTGIVLFFWPTHIDCLLKLEWADDPSWPTWWKVTFFNAFSDFASSDSWLISLSSALVPCLVILSLV